MQPRTRVFLKLVCAEGKGCQMKKKSRKMGIKKMSCGCATYSKGEAVGKMRRGAPQHWELFNIIPHYRTTAPNRCGALRPKGRRIIVIMLLSEAKVGEVGGIRATQSWHEVVALCCLSAEGTRLGARVPQRRIGNYH